MNIKHKISGQTNAKSTAGFSGTYFLRLDYKHRFRLPEGGAQWKFKQNDILYLYINGGKSPETKTMFLLPKHTWVELRHEFGNNTNAKENFISHVYMTKLVSS